MAPSSKSSSTSKPQDFRSDDIIIPVMGPTGVGKSSMINQLAGKEAVKVGHDLDSCTSAIQQVIVQHPTKKDRRIVLVDTPGFDDTYVNDVEILKSIAEWLADAYGDGMKLTGVVYLHEISLARMSGKGLKNLNMFRKLCGDEALKNVVLGTTKWDDVTPEIGQKREQQLAQDFWREMLQHGSVMMRVGTDSESSPWKIIDQILTNPVLDSVLIQKELVELQKVIPQTAAGKELRQTLQQFLEKQKEMQHLSQEDRDKNNDRIRATVHQISQLNVPLGVRIKGWLGL